MYIYLYIIYISVKLWNCRKKDECPLKGKCLTDKVVYRAIVNIQNDNKTEDYIGITGNKFKTRYTQHKSSFKPSNIQSTTLSQCINKLNSTNKKFNIEWSILRRESTFSPTTGRCNLCIAEKYIFLYRDELGTLNSRDELTAQCLHMEGLLLDKTWTDSTPPPQLNIWPFKLAQDDHRSYVLYEYVSV